MNMYSTASCRTKTEVETVTGDFSLPAQRIVGSGFIDIVRTVAMLNSQK